MTVAVLVSGSLFRQAEQRTAHSGKRYVACTIKVAAAEGAQADFWSVLAFGETAGAELMRLSVNERLAVQGSLKVEIYSKNGEAKLSRTVFADAVLPLRAAPREKKPKQSGSGPQGVAPERASMPTASWLPDDDIPF